MSPKLDATTERDITGAVYGRQQQFRNAKPIVSFQNLGTIWQTIKGEVIDDVKNSAKFKYIFEPDKGRITVDAGSI